MRRIFLFVFVMLALSLPAAAEITGDYLETRSADVYTGPCFANSEVGLTGNEAILAWHISRGAWNGVSLDGLAVVAVARASATLGDPHQNPYPAKAVLILDNKATEQQREALTGFAKEMAGELLDNIVHAYSAPIQMKVEHHASASLKAGEDVAIETRAIGEKDHLCGNEETYYPPLAVLTHAMPAVSVVDQYQGNSLGKTWTTYEKRNAFIGTFSR